MTSLLIAIVSAVVMTWSLFQLIRHKLNETGMGLAIYRRLRGNMTASRLLRAILREPLLGLTPEAAHLTETRSMMRSYWMTGLHGLIFLVALLTFAASTGLLAE